jgi:hypothetical protein
MNRRLSVKVLFVGDCLLILPTNKQQPTNNKISVMHLVLVELMIVRILYLATTC